MSFNPLISVILPVYNAELYLSIAIDSVLNQSYNNIEVIIIDDGSKDATLNIIKRYAEKDDRISFWSRENRGLTYTLNEAVQLAKGDYIARMDADDISLPQRLEKQLDLMISNEELDVVGCNYSAIDTNGQIKRHIRVPVKAEIPLALLTSVPFAHPSVLVKKAFFKKHRYKESYVEDYLLWVEGFNYGNYDNVDEDLFLYRDDYGSSFSDTKRSAMYKESMATSRFQVAKFKYLYFIDALNNKDIRFSFKARAGAAYFLNSPLNQKLKLIFNKPFLTAFVFIPLSIIKFFKGRL